MVLGSQLYGGRDYEPGVPSGSLGTAGVSSVSLSGTINLTSGTQYGIIDNFEIYGIAQSAGSGMTSGYGLIINLTVTVDGVSSTNIVTELFPFLGTGETNVIKSDRTVIPVNARYNTSASIAWTAAVQSSRLQSTYFAAIRVNGQRSS
jgi:hypothetical protein